MTYPKTQQVSDYELRNLILDGIHNLRIGLDDIGFNGGIDWENDDDVEKLERHLDSMPIKLVIELLNDLGDVEFIEPKS
jgi:hypothetical protein